MMGLRPGKEQHMDSKMIREIPANAVMREYADGYDIVIVATDMRGAVVKEVVIETTRTQAKKEEAAAKTGPANPLGSGGMGAGAPPLQLDGRKPAAAAPAAEAQTAGAGTGPAPTGEGQGVGAGAPTDVTQG